MKNIRKICRVFWLFLAILWISAVSCRAGAKGTQDDLQFLTGNASLKDADAFVFVIQGDGFKEEERDSFFAAAKDTAAYILSTSPWQENKELFKFYALFETSAESGAQGDQAATQQEAQADQRDTFYHSSYWTDGVQRLLALPEEEEQKAQLIARQFVPDTDACILLVNSQTYGGSGGDVCVASLHEDAMEIVLHELGHTIAGLGDEYWPGAEQMTETPNTTKESDPALVPWAELVGTDDIGVYPFPESGNTWYRPSDTCKMQTLGKDHDFCAVCKKTLTEAFTAHSNAQALKNLRIQKMLLRRGLPATVILLLAGGTALWIRKKKKIEKKD